MLILQQEIIWMEVIIAEIGTNQLDFVLVPEKRVISPTLNRAILFLILRKWPEKVVNLLEKFHETMIINYTLQKKLSTFSGKFLW